MQAATNVFFGVALAIFATAQATVPSVDRAVCVFTPGNTVTGHVSFSRRSPATTTTVTYSLNGLSVGAHNWHVHLYGDISQDSSMGSTGGHFVGQPTAPRTEIANFASPGTTITADANGFAESSFTDPELKLSGLNSIVGRSIVIHGDSPTNTGVRVAMCVIGIAEEGGLAGTATVTEPVTVLEASKRTLTARITGKRVSSTNGPIQKYGLGTTDEYAGTATFSGSARVTEKHSGLVASIAMLGTVADANRVPTGTVTVVETIDSNGDRLVSLRYTLEWGTGQTTAMQASGIHIHSGTSCDAGSEGGHYHDANLGDPWGPLGSQSGNYIIAGTSGSYHSYGATRAIKTGYSMDDFIGKVVVVHQQNTGGTNDKVACGIITAAPALKIDMKLHGMSASTQFNWHIHEGGTCGATADVKGHWYEATTVTTDPWWTFTAADPKAYTSDASGKLSVVDTVATGYSAMDGAGLDPAKPRTIVFHDSTGSRAACVVLSPEKDIGGGAIDGTITFQEGTTPSTTTGQPAVPYTRISYFFTGMKPGPHKLHVHANGDIQSGDVDYVGGHFTGSTTTVPVRPGVINKKVAYLQNGLPIVADKDGNCVGSFVDNTVGLLDGVNGIMGRSIVIHSPVDGSKVAQGVIGISGEYSLGGSFKATTNTAINWLTDAVKVMNGARQTETATSDGAGTKVPFVLSATCVFKRGGRAPTVDPSTKQVSQDQTIAGTITFASSMENKDVQKTTQAIYKSSNYRTVNPVVDVTWAISGSNFTDSKYTWNVEELGDLTETNSNPSGVFVGSGVHRNSARAVMGKIAETDLLDPTAYGSVFVHVPPTAVFKGASTKYPGYSGSATPPKGYVQITQAYDTTSIDASSATLKLNYKLENLELNKKIGGLHIHSGKTCADAGGHDWDKTKVSQDPWTTTWGPTDGAGLAEGEIFIRSGNSIVDVVGKAVVLHDSTGARLACAIITMDATETMAPLRMEWNMVGLEVSATGGIHIHSGTSCTDAASQGGHYYNTDMYTSSDEPWLVTKYTTDASGSSSGELTVLAGVAMSTIAPDTTTVGSNKVVVVHNAAGTRVACGILKSAGQKGTIKASADPNNPNGPRCSINSNPGACLAAGTLGNTGYLDGPSGSSTSFISGHMSDPYISLNGMNSIIGRSVVVRDTTGYSIGSCVVGRGYEKVLTQTAADYVIDALPATGATCVLQSTGVDTPSLAIANMGVYPGLSTLQPSPTGSVSLTDTIHMATATFTRYTGYAGTNLITAAGSKVTVSQISKKTLRLTYFLKSGTTIPNGRYGIHVHVGTDCGAEAGAHMWAPATDPDPWTADFAKYEITNGGVSGIAKGYFDIDIGYSLMATEGRVIVVHGSGGDKIACAKLSQESALAMEYNMENMGSNAKGGIHIHSGKTCEGATPAGHYYDTAVYTDVDLEPWKATFWTSDFGGRASGTIVINSGISVYENVDRVIVLHDGAGVKIACGKIRWARDASKTALRGNGGTDNGETGGNMDEVYGTITFENSHLTNGKTKINYNIIGLDHQSPYHSWHVHEFGDLSGGNDNGYFAGGHFVGSGDAKFIKDTYEVAYIGNSGSAGSYITTDSKGRSSGSIIDDDIQLTGLNSIIGRSIVVHGVRMNGRGAWWSTRAASCVVGRSIPESKTNSREFEDDSGIYLAYLQPYPGYNGDLIGVSGVVTVGQLDTETTVMNYELFGLESTGSQGGIHIHTGTTCATAAGHYWNEKTLVTDPWTPIKYNPTTSVRTSSGAVNVITGLSLSQNKGRTVVLHDSNGVRIACGVLGTKANSVSQLAQDAAAGGSGGACNAGSYFGVVRSMPTEVETTTNEYVSGIVSLSSSGSGTDGLELYYNLSSLVVSMPTDGTEEKRLVVGEIGKIEIHEGTTCEKTGEPFINKGTLPTLTTTPSASSGSESVGVTAANSTVSSYVKVASKMIDGAEYALTSGTVKINNGYGFSLNAGKTVVIYSKKGLKIGCAILASKGSDAALSELSTLALQGAAAYYNKANLIDTPGEILIFALSLGGCMILSILIGVCIGYCKWKNGSHATEKRISLPFGSGPAQTEHQKLGGDVEMPPLRDNFANPMQSGAEPRSASRSQPVSDRTSEQPAVATVTGSKAQLPQGWIEKVSSTHGKVYYYNTETGESSWEIPSE